MTQKMTGRRIVLRLTQEDEAHLAAVREHTRATRDPWTGKAGSLRAALREAARLITEQRAPQ
jgi:hypothetical protein